MIRLTLSTLTAVAALFLGNVADAALTVDGSRFVYRAQARLLSIRVGNNSSQPILAQIWLDRGDLHADPARLAVPFVILKPLLRLDPLQHTMVQVQYTGESLPRDRESLYWINFLEVPALPTDRSHLLRVAYRLRMKLLFRPTGLPASGANAARQLRWRVRQGALVVTNPSPVFVSVTSLRLGTGGRELDIEPFTIDPFASRVVPSPSAGTAGEIGYTFVGDGGEALSAQALIEHE
ncbi:TPA: fimbria/pilus periplasmic chaperone [Pseudomonas putida]|nr:fimbria/pilus periplasmic chaperone [Pseudomonas putida]